MMEVKCPDDKWFQDPKNQKKLISLLQKGYMFKSDRLKYLKEVMLYMLRHNIFSHKTGGHLHNTMKQVFYDYVCVSSCGEDHDNKIPVEVCHTTSKPYLMSSVLCHN